MNNIVNMADYKAIEEYFEEMESKHGEMVDKNLEFTSDFFEGALSCLFNNHSGEVVRRMRVSAKDGKVFRVDLLRVE